MTDKHCIQLPLEPETIELMEQALELKNAIKVKKALAALYKDSNYAKFPSKKVRFLRTFTIEPYLPFIEFSAARRGFKLEISIGDLGGIESEIMKTDESFDASFVFWRITDLLPKLFDEFFQLNSEEREGLMQSLSLRLEKLAQWMQVNLREPTFFSTFYEPENMKAPVLNLHHEQSLKMNICRWNLELHELMQRYSNWRLFDIEKWLRHEGFDALDLRMDLYGQIPFSLHKAYGLGEVIVQHITLLWKPRIKVIAVDLDHTLWGGILGEDGIENLKIGQEYPGNVYWKIQQVLKDLKASGVLLVLLSKNNMNEVEMAFEAMREMPLHLSDFVAHRVNFEPKWKNLKDVAQELSLGTNSFAFLDDQAFEREQMKQYLPEVTLLNCDESPEHILQSFSFEGLDVINLEEEDLKRHQEYQLKTVRENLKQSSTNLVDFLSSLELEIEIFEMEERHIARAAQMLAKTNQFNLTTRRHDEKHLRNLSECQNKTVLLGKVKDRFSDQGITALVVLEGTEGELCIESFLMSCRILGRKVEEAMWNAIVQYAKKHDYEKIRSQYLSTEKNNQVAELYETLGMECIEKDESRKEYCAKVNELNLKDISYMSVAYPFLGKGK